jgi:hypothetical protein
MTQTLTVFVKVENELYALLSAIVVTSGLHVYILAVLLDLSLVFMSLHLEPVFCC